jgi:signal transduction histidine kinase
MNNEIKSSDILDGRTKTDKSLGAERAKTNFSLSDGKHLTEQAVDSLVRQDRAQADSVSTIARATSDDGLPQASVRLTEERVRADEALELERLHMDQAIEKERQAKNLLAAKLFKIERELTDRNLLGERTRTDLDATKSQSLLTSEIAAHAKTKTNLTTREEFLAVVSHDLRNPVGAITSCADMLLLDGEFETLSVEVRHWIEFMKRNADSALRLIGDLLEMERIASGKLELNLERTSVTKLVAETNEMFSIKAKNKNIELKFHPGESELFAVLDHDRIGQVLANLVGNAMKYTAEGGAITVSTLCKDEHLEINVVDTGSGIPPDKLDHIFDRFAQLASMDRSGLGLGLYISKMFVEAHQGTLTVKTKLGSGTSFKIELLTAGPQSLNVLLPAN